MGKVDRLSLEKKEKYISRMAFAVKLSIFMIVFVMWLAYMFWHTQKVWQKPLAILAFLFL